MFNNVWKWAGKFRQSNKNLGVEYWDLGISLSNLIKNTNYWLENETFEQDEIVIRFKHQLVCINCFSNGNGRHSRIMADLFNEKVFEGKPFTWGSVSYDSPKNRREKYINCIRNADNKKYSSLIEFARS